MEGNTTISDVYGINVFNDALMRQRLPKKIYIEFKKTIESGESLKAEVAEVVANAMKDWAIEKGATHYTHWFQPMTNITAEKHEAFLNIADGKAIMEFSGKELIKGEPDASSLPSGGLRATFEARGYTAWDCTSPAFLREDASGVILCIPTVFCSYTGEALDKKTPLLRSNEAINIQAMRILKLFGNTASKNIVTSVGAEQEYFLINQSLYRQRKDLIFTGRTLFGAKPPKGQELDDHYFGAVNERVACFMKELNEVLWKLGISAKTQHNETAPAQYEIAPIYENTNIATDHNQIIMEALKRVAGHHGFACLLHEKPFSGINGSGKHNNWSLATDDGKNLLDPGKTPHENAQFLLFLLAVVKAVDDNNEMLRLSACNPGNEHRLGSNEAPPAIISIFLGDQLEDILDQIEKGDLTRSKQGENMTIGVSTLPVLKKDVTDRNRTSPFAFTGNKFEFRMVPSSASISGPNFVLNTIVADVLCQFADELEGAENFTETLNSLIKRTVKEHRKIIFNGNGYSEEWEKEAQRRGLSNLKSLVDAVPYYTTEKTLKMFKKFNVLTETEAFSRAEIKYDSYIKQLNIEARTMIDMASKDIRPAVIRYAGDVASALNSVKEAGFDSSGHKDLLLNLLTELKKFDEGFNELKNNLDKALQMQCKTGEKARYYKDFIVPAMDKLREPADKLEMLVDGKYWPFPTYGELLFSI
ncbi:MAG: glutamine synthetase III [Lachnospiraceae bacterium]|nr:glutamine synthetase III [Lachnospiraceae bacterium]